MAQPKMYDLISKFHAMGQPLEDAVAASTSRPAKVLGMDKEIGTLAEGAVADIAVLDPQEGNHVWQDMAGHTVSGNLRLATFATLKDSTVVWREGNYLGRIPGAAVQILYHLVKTCFDKLSTNGAN